MWLSKGMVIESFSIDVYPQNDVVINIFSPQMTIRVDKKNACETEQLHISLVQSGADLTDISKIVGYVGYVFFG